MPARMRMGPSYCFVFRGILLVEEEAVSFLFVPKLGFASKLGELNSAQMHKIECMLHNVLCT